MKKEPTIQDVLNVLQGFSAQVDKRFDGIDKRLDGMDKRFIGIDTRLDKMDTRLGKLEMAFINLDDKVGRLDNRVTHLEAQHERTFRRIDDFLIMANRHEAEIAALRCADARLDERLTILEKKVTA